MKLLKIAVLSIILLSLFTMGGCATFPGPESSITGFQKVSFEKKEVHLSLPVVVEKDMETKKTPDATEKAVASEVYTNLKENLARGNILSSRKNNNLISVELKVHYIDEYFGAYKYFGVVSDRGVGGQIIMVRAVLKKEKIGVVAQIDSLHNTASYISRKPLTSRVAPELANQIEKILKEGVSIGKSP